MDETKYKILDMLARNLGRPMSIRELTRKMEQAYGGAHYANTHEKVHEMARDNIVLLSKSGRSSIVLLHFENYLLIDLLAEMELVRKRGFLKGKQEMQMLMMEIDTLMHNIPLIKSVSLMSPERNAKLNKAEIMFLLKPPAKAPTEKTKISIGAAMSDLQKRHNVRINYLILEEGAFADMLKSNEGNPLKEMLRNKIVTLHPQGFWMPIRGEVLRGSAIIAEEKETHPARISGEDLIFNLARFGYTEFGPKLEQCRPFCIEYIISAIMFSKDARRMDAIPIILAKSRNASYDLLLFLAQKYDFEGRILGILKVLRSLVAHRLSDVDEPIRLLEARGTKEIKASAKSVKEKLRLYNVT